jgi:Fe-S oxidoreductase
MNILDQLMNCSLCPNICKYACPMEDVWATESSSPSGKARTALLLLQDRIPWNEENVKILYQCLDCWASKEPCPFENLIIGDLLVEARKEAVKREVIIPEVALTMRSLKEHGNPYNKERVKSDASIEGSEIIYFPGCTADVRERKIVSATTEVLKNTGLKSFTLRGFCCGWPALQIGDEESFLELSKKTAEAFETFEGKTILVSCPSCFEFFTRDYPKRGINLKAEVLHTSTFFLDLLKKEKNLITAQSSNREIAYHDPCALGRKLGIYDAPREVLRFLGFHVLEPTKTMEYATCCGGGGIVEKSILVAQNRKQELLSTNAKIFATACPTCKMMLSKTGLEIYALSELVAKSFRVK